MNNITFDWSDVNMSLSEVNECRNVAGQINIECISRTICTQLETHYIKAGLIILIIYSIVHLGCRWFFKKGYKYIDTDFFNDVEVRRHWDAYIKNRLMCVMAVYIGMIVYLQWG